MRIPVKSENIFKDVFFSEQEAEYLMIRSRLMLEVELFVKRSGLTQPVASKKLDITQPRLNDLLRGKSRVQHRRPRENSVTDRSPRGCKCESVLTVESYGPSNPFPFLLMLEMA